MHTFLWVQESTSQGTRLLWSSEFFRQLPVGLEKLLFPSSSEPIIFFFLNLMHLLLELSTWNFLNSKTKSSATVAHTFYSKKIFYQSSEVQQDISTKSLQFNHMDKLSIFFFHLHEAEIQSKPLPLHPLHQRTFVFLRNWKSHSNDG